MSSDILFCHMVFKWRWSLVSTGDGYYLLCENGKKTPKYSNTGTGNIAEILHGLLGEAYILEQA